MRFVENLRAGALAAALLSALAGAACGQEPGSARANDAALRARLTPLQYRVTQEDGTEPPFRVLALYRNDQPRLLRVAGHCSPDYL